MCALYIVYSFQIKCYLQQVPILSLSVSHSLCRAHLTTMFLSFCLHLSSAIRLAAGSPPTVERGSSVVECRTRNQVRPGLNPPLLLFRRLGIFVLSIDALVDSDVKMSTWL